MKHAEVLRLLLAGRYIWSSGSPGYRKYLTSVDGETTPLHGVTMNALHAHEEIKVIEWPEELLSMRPLGSSHVIWVAKGAARFLHFRGMLKAT